MDAFLAAPLASRPVSCRFVVAKFTPQLARERAERAAPGDRIPAPAPADPPPKAAPAGRDLPCRASPERAQAAHTPHRRKRVTGLNAFNRLIGFTHGEVSGYPIQSQHPGQIPAPSPGRSAGGPEADVRVGAPLPVAFVCIGPSHRRLPHHADGTIQSRPARATSTVQIRTGRCLPTSPNSNGALIRHRTDMMTALLRLVQCASTMPQIVYRSGRTTPKARTHLMRWARDTVCLM